MSIIKIYVCDRCKRQSNSRYELFDGTSLEESHFNKIINNLYGIDLCFSCIGDLKKIIDSYLKGE